MLTRTEVAKMCRIRPCTVYWYARKYNIDYFIKKSPHNGSQTMYFPDDAVERINQIRGCDRKTEQHKEQNMEELHPLVTDKRCFKFNWWPDPLPDEDE